MDQEHKNGSSKSYNEILKSASVIGGSSIITIFLRIIRTKFLAVLLGPAGVGLVGIYESITSLADMISGMGIKTSGIRQTAEAVSMHDRQKIARTIFTLRRLSILLGVVGTLLLIALSAPVSLVTFGSTDHHNDIALLSVILFLNAVSGGQYALIQGMRRIGDLARLSILSALFGTIFSIPIVYVWGQRGIVPYLIAVAAMNILASWWYARKIGISYSRMGWSDIRLEAGPLLKFGVAFMSTATMTIGTTYLIRVLVVRTLGLDATGLYQAAATLSVLYVGFILDAMGKDFYPRLTAIAKDDRACNKLINEQAEVGFLLSVPGIMATLVFAPVVLFLFYSTQFMAAYDILRWQLLGILLRMATWPMAFVIIAKGEMKLFFWTELLANAVLLGLTWPGILYFGLPGTGMAFFGMYLFYWFLIFFVIKRMTGFSWSAANTRLGLLSAPVVVLVFSMHYVLTQSWYMILGGAISIAFGLYSIKCLVRMVAADGMMPVLAKIKKNFGFVLSP